MAVDAETMGRRIAEARGRADLTQAKLAAAIGLDRSALAKIEVGSRRITALELARVAEALDVRIEWFVQETPAAIVSRRNAQEPGAPSPRIDLMIERVAQAVEFVAGQGGRLLPPALSPKAMPTDEAQAEALAEDTRRLLGGNDQGPLMDLTRRAALLGVLVFSWDLGTESADAAMVLLRTGGVAVINGERRVGRRRLACAHELGHYIVADEYTVDWRIAEQQDVEQREGLIDYFARALLLPRASVTREWRALREGGEGLRAAAIRMGSSYRVDMATLARRLRELNLVGPEHEQKIRTFRTTRADILDFDLVVGEDLKPPSLPRVYERAVLDLYRSETISASRALDLVLGTWDEDWLPALPSRAENEIWEYV